MRYASARYVVLTAALAMACAAVLVLSTPVLGDNPPAPGNDPLQAPVVTVYPPAHAVGVLTAHAKAVRWLSGQLRTYQKATWYWQNLMMKPHTPTEGRVLYEMSIPDIKAAVRYWQQQATAARNRAQNPPHLQDWLCIHSAIKNGRWTRSLQYIGGGYHVAGSGEGSWRDTGDPYWGGLQMDRAFMIRYGGWLYRAKGPASNWPPLAQIWVAEKAYESGRGFYPWPNTARACGLI